LIYIPVYGLNYYKWKNFKQLDYIYRIYQIWHDICLIFLMNYNDITLISREKGNEKKHNHKYK